ncbi:MAG: hypothetical protein RIR97_1429 [Pseudomonadota bacterium]
MAPQYRLAFIESRGVNAWKGVYSVISLIALVILIYGYGLARMSEANVQLWSPPRWTVHLNMTLMLFAIVFLVASQVPAGRIARSVKHPMVLSVKIWALAHLAVNGTLVDMILFGAFLAWGVLLRISYARGERDGSITPRAFAGGGNDVIVLIVSAVVYLALLMFLHTYLIGVSPFATLGLR